MYHHSLAIVLCIKVFDLSLKNFGKMDGNAAEYNVVDETCDSF